MGYSFVLYKHGPYSFDLKLDTVKAVGTPHVEAGAVNSTLRAAAEVNHYNDKAC